MDSNINESNISNTLYFLLNNLSGISFVSYFFWSGISLIVGSITLQFFFSSYSPKINNQTVCSASSNVLGIVSLWLIEGISFVSMCIAYSLVESTCQTFDNFTLSIQTMGVIVKYLPTWIRLIHIFTFCQINTLFVQFSFLPECNTIGLQITLIISSVTWWFVTIFGLVCKKRIVVPPHIFDPLRARTSFFTEVHLVLKTMGP
ncbi:hypothetical protein RS030_172685 [Cryptosporidium xiaoi]|uniref:Transmembrane protein n=1 Tax=Cryptosporidium xiaoi TaxID=659607 RepID=A0AAV9Y317_9CRYT